MQSHCADLLARPPVSFFQPPKIAVGLRQMALMTVCSALEDSQGRRLYARSDEEKRKIAADGLRWLRDRKSDRVFSLNWCSELLGVSAEYLGLHGVSRIGNGGLSNWRQWRKHRDDHSRIQKLPILVRVCPQCHRKFKTKNATKVHCSQACAVAHQARQPRPARIVHRCVCLHCNETFTARDSGRTFCSPKCAHDWQRERRYKHYHKHQEQLACV